jgi:hypothetical protein
MSLRTRRQRHTMSADGITHALTWRPARPFLGETAGLWALYTPAEYLNDRHCGGALDFFYAEPDVAPGELSAWTATAVGFPADLESVEPPPRPFGDTTIETRFWVRRAS